MNRIVFPAIFVCLVIANNVNWGVSGIEGDTDLNDLRDTVKKNLGQFGSDLPNFDKFNESIPALDEGEKALRKKCEKNSQFNNSFEKTVEAKKEFEYCVKSLVDINELKNEINVAKPNGEIDKVFKKYCQKKPYLEDCVYNFTSTLDACLDEEEKDSKKLLQGVIEELLTFVCTGDGDRIALFYSEGGPDCLMDKQEAIQHCVNKSFSKYMSHGEPNYASLPAFKFEDEQCKSVFDLKECIVAEVTKCEGHTTANLVDSLFKNVGKTTPCIQFKSSASVFLPSTISVIALGSLATLLGHIGFE